MANRFITDIDNWHRVGRGHSFDFNASALEIFEILNQRLLPEFAPYQLITAGAIPKKGERIKYHWIAHENILSDFCTLSEKGVWDFFVRSLKLSPVIDWSTITYPDAICGINGLINLQHNTPVYTHYRSSIGIVSKIANETGTRVIEHREYREIFEALRRAFRKLRKSKGTPDRS